ncbi:TVP38/TMEM64 family protein [Spartinivicinus ruber]|uniref:TVP38/TMEM64 family protein n=1 Tax=Spartinivicinus ruber TaxID=2683272 RepID=UPI0013D3F95F|nr:TVP38/TMEM64 family protein [Spartinivicinus ruber]
MSKSKLIVLAIVIIGIGLFFAFGFHQHLTVDGIKNLYAEQIGPMKENNPFMLIAIFFVVYVFVTALSLPGAAIMTIIAGLIFGLLTGVIIVSFASTIGATLAFLISRTLLGDWVQHKFASHLKTINEGIEQEGGFYLFTLRLIPAIPFFIINLVMGLTPIRVLQFFLVSQVGMLPGTIVYVNAGASLSNVEELSVTGLFTPGIIISFLLLAAFPWIAKGIVKLIKVKQSDQDIE